MRALLYRMRALELPPVTIRKRFTFIADEDDAGLRLDSFLASELPELSRSRIQKAIRTGEALVNGVAVVKPSRRVAFGDEISLAFSPPEPLSLVPEPLPLDIVFEDEHLLVVNKSPGMVVHPAPGHETGTLVHALLYHCRNLSGIGGYMRPGIVHRLDAGTSGLLAVAKSDEAHIGLSRQLMDRQMHRVYVAIVWGELPEQTGLIDLPIGRSPRDRKKMAVVEGGKEARTVYSVIDTYGPFQYIKLELETGRTHQIRVHLSRMGHPVVGDPVYGGRRPSRRNLSKRDEEVVSRVLSLMGRQALHAKELSFFHPITGDAMSFSAREPADIEAVLSYLATLGIERRAGENDR